MCGSSNITVTNPACGSLAVNSVIPVELNVTNAPDFNGYEFSLYFDPNFLQWDHSNITAGTIFSNPFTVLTPEQQSPVPGTYRLVVVNNGGTNSAPSGILAHVYFKILAVGVSPLALAAGIANPSVFSTDGAWTRLVLGSSPIYTGTSDGYFTNDPTRLGPVASFSYTPTSIQAGDTVTFDASASYDPDKPAPAIANYVWDFGATGGQGGGVSSQTASIQHTFGATASPLIGNFSVRLTVFDRDDGLEGIKTVPVYVAQIPLHDIEISSLTALPSSPHVGDNVTITVVVKNVGTFDEQYNLTLTYGPPTTTIQTGITNEMIPKAGTTFATISHVYTLETTGLSPGAYSIDALVTIPVDQNPSNNAARQVITIQGASSSQYVYLLVGAVVVAAAIVAVSLFLRRRRRQRPEPE